MNMNHFWSKVSDFRNVISPTEEHKKKIRRKLENLSAEGRPEQIERLNKIFEENQELDEIKKSGTVVLDQSISNKLFDRHSKLKKNNNNQ